MGQVSIAARTRVRGGSQVVHELAPSLAGRSPRARGKRPGPLPASMYDRSIPACAGEAACSIAPSADEPVDPRVRGGSCAARSSKGFRRGRSPRARGKQDARPARVHLLGSIPACAGEATRSERADRRGWVDPRVRGGSSPTDTNRALTDGRSPRARGKLADVRTPTDYHGSIPACAGEAPAMPIGPLAPSVDPRVRGGSIGKLWDRMEPTRRDKGRSPRARGKPASARRPTAAWRSIPACAGEAARPDRVRVRPTVDPRVRGGSSSSSTTAEPSSGRSPRARGKQEIALARCGEHGSIPACAGEAVRRRQRARPVPVDPRVRGGSEKTMTRDVFPHGRSPRARGKRHPCRHSRQPERSIPACAGEARNQRAEGKRTRVDPRVRGGSRVRCDRMAPATGRSPRARGKPREVRQSAGLHRSIPACAGEAGP